MGAAPGVVDGIAPNSGFVVFAAGVDDEAGRFPKRDGVGADDDAGLVPVAVVLFGVDCAPDVVGNENAGEELNGEAVVAGLAEPNSPSPPLDEVVAGFPNSDGCGALAGGVAAGVVDPVPNKVLFGAGVEAPPKSETPDAGADD